MSKLFKKDATILINGSIDDKTVSSVFHSISEIHDKGSKEIDVIISSMGGCVFNANAVIALLIGSGLKINTHAIGSCHSMAFIIFMLNGESTRTCDKNTVFMHHSTKWDLQDNDAEQLKVNVKLDEYWANSYNDAIIKKTKLTKKVLEDNRHIDFYIFGKDIEKYGIAQIT